MTANRACNNEATSGTEKFLEHVHEFLRDIGRQATPSLLAERILKEFIIQTQYRQGLLYVENQEMPGQYQLLSVASREDDLQSFLPPTLTLSHPIVHQLVQEQNIIDWGFQDDGCIAIKERSSSPMATNVAIPFLMCDRMIAFALLLADHNSPTYHALPTLELKVIAQGGANSLASLIDRNHRTPLQFDRRAERLRSLETLASGLAHQIRNPLTSIKTFIQLAPERKDDVAFLQEFSQVVLSDIHRIERLINEILDYSRSLEPRLVEEDLNAIIASCLYLLDSSARSRGIVIEQQLAPDLPAVLLDQQQIKHALVQILSNSLDAMNGQGGILRIRTSVGEQRPKRSVRIDIQDTGRGISPADLEHIFDPFYTTKHASPDHEGAGLGLFMAHQIIQEHRGTILVRSEEGVGTTFCITFPAVN